MEKIKWGILAPGRIASQFTEALISVEDAVFYGAASRDKEKAEEFRVRFGGKKSFGSYDEILKDPEVDVVYIASPHPFHKDIALKALDAGKPVLCEKPLSVNYKDTLAMVESARKNNVFLMEGMWTRFMPALKEVKRRVDAGELGEIRMIRADFSFMSSPDTKARHLNPDLAGGGLLDVGIYPLALCSWIMGCDPEKIASLSEIGPTGVDTVSGAVLKYKSGTIASLTFGVQAHGPVTAEIIGTKGTAEIPRMFHCSEKSRFITPEKTETFEMPHHVNGFEYEVAAVNKALKEGKKEHPVMPLDETLRLARIMEDMRKEWGITFPFE